MKRLCGGGSSDEGEGTKKTRTSIDSKYLAELVGSLEALLEETKSNHAQTDGHFQEIHAVVTETATLTEKVQASAAQVDALLRELEALKNKEDARELSCHSEWDSFTSELVLPAFISSICSQAGAKSTSGLVQLWIPRSRSEAERRTVQSGRRRTANGSRAAAEFVSCLLNLEASVFLRLSFKKTLGSVCS